MLQDELHLRQIAVYLPESFSLSISVNGICFKLRLSATTLSSSPDPALLIMNSIDLPRAVQELKYVQMSRFIEAIKH